MNEERRTKSEDCEADELVKFMSTRTNPIPHKYEKVATRFVFSKNYYIFAKEIWIYSMD